MAKKNLVIDTSVFLSDATCIFKFGNADIFIAFKVLEEIDKHKKRQDSVGYNARKIIKIMDGGIKRPKVPDPAKVPKRNLSG